ncbi:MAG: CRISPR system precrRNA processing endoribonuclease RAMP protein Cas6 [Deltaproteobacteria bacterium]|nr:CRISPR system precrRNA processing endoribonuclease RAMP protein Cas6 [Deltaproteobacteria bacterium]
MPDFTLTRFRFTLELLGSGHLPPYKGSTIRGAVGTALHDMACKHRGRRCEGCPQLESCVYIRLFKPDQMPGKSIPAGYVIDPPHMKETYFKAGDSLTFTLTLFGRASEHIGAWIEAVRHCGEHCGLGGGHLKFCLKTVECLGPDGEVVLFWKDGAFCPGQTVTSITPADLFAPAAGSGGTIAVRLLTPMKLKDGGGVSATLDARVFFEALARRLKTLARFYHEADALFADLSSDIALAAMENTNLRWVVLERPSRTQQSSVNLGGFVGTFILRHVSPRLQALLRLGELTHIGRNTVCGCGKYRLEQFGAGLPDRICAQVGVLRPGHCQEVRTCS